MDEAPDLNETHDYEGQLAYYAAHPDELIYKPDDDNDRSYAYLKVKAKAHICLGEYEAAIDCLEEAAVILPKAFRYKPGTRQSLDALWALVKYLQGDAAAAIAYHKDVLHGHTTGRLKYSRMSGGLGNALHLWYYAEAANDTDSVEPAVRFIRSYPTIKSKSPLAKFEVAALAVGDISELELLQTRYGVGDWESARQNHQTIGMRSMLETDAFHAACARGRRGDRGGRQDLIQFSATKVEPTYSCEWFLARQECKLPFRWKRSVH